MKFSQYIKQVFLVVILSVTLIGCVNDDDNLTPHFFPTLGISVSGSGLVRAKDGSIDCESSCTYTYLTDKTVELEAFADELFTFVEWEGCNEVDQNVCRIDIDVLERGVSVVAHFLPEVSINKIGKGSVSSNASIIDCGLICTAAFEEDQTLELFATPDQNYRFLRWEGCARVDEDICFVDVLFENGGASVVAEFMPLLTISKVGKGTVNANDGSISCGENCSADYEVNQSIELNATPDNNYVFLDWQGCEPAEESTCLIDVGPGVEGAEVFARFNPSVINIYKLTFEEPEHVVGSPPGFGYDPFLVQDFGDIFVRYTPEIITDGINKSLLFEQELISPGNNAGDTMLLPLRLDAEFYSLEMDLVLYDLDPPFAIHMNWGRSNSPDEVVGIYFDQFNTTGRIHARSLTSAVVGSYVPGQEFHLRADINILSGTATIHIDDTISTNILLDPSVTDIGNLRFYMFGGDISSQVSVDNIVVNARLDGDAIRLPAGQQPQLTIDFESQEQRVFSQHDFLMPGVFGRQKIDAGTGLPVAGGGYGNSIGRALIYHKYQFPFRLHSVDIAKYSDIVDVKNDVEVIGVTIEGEQLSRVINKDLISNEFITFSFDETWAGLKFLLLSNEALSLSIDDVVLEIADDLIGYDAGMIY